MPDTGTILGRTRRASRVDGRCPGPLKHWADLLAHSPPASTRTSTHHPRSPLDLIAGWPACRSRSKHTQHADSLCCSACPLHPSSQLVADSSSETGSDSVMAFRSLPALSSTACSCSVRLADCSTTSPLDALNLLLPKPKGRQTYGMPTRDGPAGRWLSSKGLQGRKSILAFVPPSSRLPLATPVLAQHAEGGRSRTRYGRRGAVPRRDCAQVSFLLRLPARPRLLADDLSPFFFSSSAGPSMEPSLYSCVPFSSPDARRTAFGERACSASSSVRPPHPRFPLASSWLYAYQLAHSPSVLLTVDMGLHARTVIKGPSLMLLRSLASHY